MSLPQLDAAMHAERWRETRQKLAALAAEPPANPRPKRRKPKRRKPGLDPLTQAAVDAARLPLPPWTGEDEAAFRLARHLPRRRRARARAPQRRTAVAEHAPAPLAPSGHRVLTAAAAPNGPTPRGPLRIFGPDGREIPGEWERCMAEAAAFKQPLTAASSARPATRAGSATLAPATATDRGGDVFTLAAEALRAMTAASLAEARTPVPTTSAGLERFAAAVERLARRPINVHVAAPDTPQVTVNVPEQPTPPAPVVHVHPTPPPQPRKMRIEENPVTGVRTVSFDDGNEQ
jgi:hypothetical protein